EVQNLLTTIVTVTSKMLANTSVAPSVGLCHMMHGNATENSFCPEACGPHFDWSNFYSAGECT
ncbi:unnamed protein product, partial [Bubo scandiacus]